MRTNGPIDMFIGGKQQDLETFLNENIDFLKRNYDIIALPGERLFQKEWNAMTDSEKSSWKDKSVRIAVVGNKHDIESEGYWEYVKFPEYSPENGKYGEYPYPDIIELTGFNFAMLAEDTEDSIVSSFIQGSKPGNGSGADFFTEIRNICISSIRQYSSGLNPTIQRFLSIKNCVFLTNDLDKDSVQITGPEQIKHCMILDCHNISNCVVVQNMNTDKLGFGTIFYACENINNIKFILMPGTPGVKAYLPIFVMCRNISNIVVSDFDRIINPERRSTYSYELALAYACHHLNNINIDINLEVGITKLCSFCYMISNLSISPEGDMTMTFDNYCFWYCFGISNIYVAPKTVTSTTHYFMVDCQNISNIIFNSGDNDFDYLLWRCSKITNVSGINKTNRVVLFECTNFDRDTCILAN